jgi:LPXTG-motif cell wall-anchored protein
MPLTGDQKKHLLIGGGVSALALVAGYLIFGGRKSRSAGLPGRVESADARHDRRRRHHRHEQGSPTEIAYEGDEHARPGDNERGKYGRKRHHHHGEGGHG